MAASPRELQTKRSLDANEVLSEGQLKEKRPRLESENSEIVEDVTDREELEMDISDVTSGREEAHDDVSTELIYKLSPENDESLLSIPESKSSSKQPGPSKSEENNENREERLKKESDNEEGEEANSEEEHSESDHDSGSEDDEEGDSEGNEGNEELKDAMEVKESGRSNEETTRPSVENMSDEDSEESGGEQDHGTGLAEEHDDSSAEETVSNVGKENTELVQEEEDTSDNSEEEEGVREYNKVSEMKAVELVPVSSDDEEREIKMPQELHKKKDVAEHESVTSDDEHSPNHKKSNKAQKEPTGKHTAETVGEKKRSEERKQGEKDAPDGGEMFGRTDDYSKRSVEDLEDLQEDIHKELAQINEKSEQRKKHKKTGSSGHREKRHKEKSVSRHKDKTRDKERERQRSSENRGDSRKDHEKSYERGRKHYEHFDHEDKHWSHDSRRSRSQKEEHRHRNEKLIWSQSRPERAPSRAESNKSGNSRREVKESKVYKAEKNPNEARATASQDQSGKNDEKKGFISDSMREMIRESMKERKGLSLEVVEEESDDSGGEQLLDGKASDVSSASSSSEDEQEAESSPEVPKLPPYLPAVQGCRNVEEFQWLNRIEEGTYGVVYRAKDKRSGEIVALKKLKMEKEKEGFPITSLREINTLLKAQHPNIVTVQEIVVGSNMDKIYIVMDFVEHDLKALMETMTQAFLAGEIKTIMIQLLRAVSHLHDNWILHRDIKTSNLLLSNKGILKVGDFGLAREYGSPLKPYTPIVVTLWYRAPELLLGAKEYATPIDLWSVGCVFAELLTMKPLFNGQSEISQINKIFKELGTPSDKIWPGPPAYSEYPATKKMTFAEYPYNNLRNRFGATLTDNGFDLLNSFLTYDPKRRISADEALKHEYFQELPRPVEPSMFPSWPARSEGAKRAKKASPKAPEGGNFYKTLSGDGDKAFHMPAGKSQGSSAVPGFTLKF